MSFKIKNVSELNEGNVIQYVGNTLDMFGKLMVVKSINTEKNQAHVVGLHDDHYLSRCDAKNIIFLTETAPEKIKIDHYFKLMGLTTAERKAFDVTPPEPIIVIDEYSTIISGVDLDNRSVSFNTALDTLIKIADAISDTTNEESV